VWIVPRVELLAWLREQRNPTISADDLDSL
jgi:hypothetical protein